MLNAPEEKSGMAASIEDVSYELGGVLGITLLGGLMTAVYSHSLTLPGSLPVSDIAYDSIDEALRLAATLADERAEQLRQLARTAFDRAFIAVLIAAALLMALGASMAKWALGKK
ncbi:Methyl viologen resistance protein SmvA [compost metagenome]